MNILMVVSNFYPEIGSASHVYFDLARSFVKKGHKVSIITSYPRKYNLNSQDQSKEFPLYECIEGVNINRVKHSHTRDNIIARGLEHFLLPGYYFKKYRELKSRFDVCLIYIPPLPLYKFAQKIRQYDGIPSVLNFQDFHPQELTDVGVLKNPFIVKFLESAERKAYKNADYITVLSQGGINYVIKKGGDPDKISHIYNSILLSDQEDFFAHHDFKKKEQIEDKFLISYAGILSPFQGIDNVLDVAGEFLDQNEIIFYIIGDGMIKNHLEQRVENEHLDNVRILPFQPRDEYYNIVNSSDINLITLDERMKAPCLPGKTMNLFAAGKPVIAIVGEDTETAKVVNSVEPGNVIVPGDIEALKKAIIRLKNDSVMGAKIGEKEKAFFEMNMTLEKNTGSYLEIFESLTGMK